jgi:hypothetical protein
MPEQDKYQPTRTRSSGKIIFDHIFLNDLNTFLREIGQIPKE